MRLLPHEESFFDLLEAAATNALNTARLFRDMVEDYRNLPERVQKIADAEHAGDRIIHQIMDKLKDRTQSLKVKKGTELDAEMGPIVSKVAHDRITGYIGQGEQEGAKLVVDGRNRPVAGHENGFFLGTTLFDKVTPEMKIYRDEIFGPVLVVLRAETL